MPAGKRRHRIVLQSSSTSAHATSGQLITTWTDWAWPWAEVLHVTGTERYTESTKLAEVDVIFKIGYLDGVTPQLRVQWDDATWDISRVIDPKERRRELWIYATREVPERG